MADGAVSRQRPWFRPDNDSACNLFLNEEILFLVFKATHWNPLLICLCSCVCKQLSHIGKRILWKEFCLSRAPKMVSDLISGTKKGHVEGGWETLGKLMLHCAGCQSSSPSSPLSSPGHFVWKCRFSRTFGQCFIVPKCKSDVLYVTDPCEHEEGSDKGMGLFRGIFKDFSGSLTRKLLIQRSVELEENEKCPYCRVKCWNMSEAKLIPKAAWIRLGAVENSVECFVCLNGHMNGKCLLVPLSDSEGRD